MYALVPRGGEKGGETLSPHSSLGSEKAERNAITLRRRSNPREKRLSFVDGAMSTSEGAATRCPSTLSPPPHFLSTSLVENNQKSSSLGSLRTIVKRVCFFLLLFRWQSTRITVSPTYPRNGRTQPTGDKQKGECNKEGWPRRRNKTSYDGLIIRRDASKLESQRVCLREQRRKGQATGATNDSKCAQ